MSQTARYDQHQFCPKTMVSTLAILEISLLNVVVLTTATLAPRPMTAVFGLGTRLRVRMRTKSENGVLRNGQQPQSVVNGFY